MVNYSAKDTQKYLNLSLELNKTDKTFKDIYDFVCSHHSKKVASIYFDEDNRVCKLTYSEMQSRIFYLSTHLYKGLENLPKGAPIALKLKNGPNWPALFWAILMSGHPVLLIDARLAHDNTENLLKQAKAGAIIASEEGSYSIPLYRLNDIRSMEEDVHIPPNIWANKVYFCSSGTTGDAKIIIMNGENLTNMLQGALILSKTNTKILHPGNIRNLAMIPFHHIFGFSAVFLWYFFYGKTIVYPNSIGTSDLLFAIKKAKVTHLYSVPLFWDGIAQKVIRSFTLKGEKKLDLLNRLISYNNRQIPKEKAGLAKYSFVGKLVRKKILGNNIEWCISGGGYLQARTLALINGLGYPLANGYGMTEIGVSSVESSENISQRLKGSIGSPLLGYEYKIVPTANSKEGEGELLVKSLAIHKEEIIGGKLQKTVFDDGYFHTGDIAAIDSQGSVYIRSRIKDTIISSNGENVYPDEIESYFQDLPRVLSLAVIGVNKANKEEIYLILDVDNNIKEEELTSLKTKIEDINTSLPNEKKISKTLVYRNSLPMANNMKVKRFALKTLLEEKPNDFYDLESKKSNSLDLSKFDQKEVKEISEAIRKIFSKTLLLPEFKIGNDDIWNQSLGGDSMSYVSMINDLNEYFHLEIPTELYGKLGSVSDFTVQILEMKHSTIERKRKEKDLAREKK